jgi:WD40 repeat protein
VANLSKQEWEPGWQETDPAMIRQWGVAIARDGKTLATAHGDQVVKLWDVPTGKVRQTLGGHQAEVHAVAFAPDNATIATGDHPVVRLWDARTGRETGSFQAQDKSKDAVVAAVLVLAFSPGGKILAAAGNDGSVRLHDLTTNRETARLTQGIPILSLAFSTDGARLASAGWGESVIVWDVSDGAKRAETELKTPDFHSLAFQPGSQRLAISGPQVVLWDPR